MEICPSESIFYEPKFTQAREEEEDDDKVYNTLIVKTLNLKQRCRRDKQKSQSTELDYNKQKFYSHTSCSEIDIEKL